jgi:hypothetical protein
MRPDGIGEMHERYVKIGKEDVEMQASERGRSVWGRALARMFSRS